MMQNLKVSILIFLLLLSFMGFSQSFKSGLMLGLVGSQIDGDNSAGYHKAGISTGIYTRFDFSEKWYGQVEIKYIQKGSYISNKKTIQFYKIKLNYIDIAFLPSFKYKKKWAFSAGLSYSYLINAYMADSYGEIPLDKYSFRLSDYNIIIKASYFINEHWSLDSRIAYSIWYIAEYPRQFNNLISLHLNYEF